MKNINFLYFILSLFLIGIGGCDFLGSYERGNGNVINTSRELPTFNKISIGGNFEVILEKSSEEAILISTDENLEPLIKTVVNDHILSISANKKLISANKTTITIHYRMIEEIDISGATLLKNEDLLETTKLKLDLAGAGVIDLKIKTNNLEAELGGAGLVKLNGYAPECRISLSGAGGLEAYGLETDNCTIDVSGIGGAKINVKNKLSANIEGVGGIQYIGHPATVEKNVSGIGTIKQDDDEHDDPDI